ncbi:ATPase family AAA domain-containing protein 2-like isoform X3 [Portunus trituberculatus]|uniref:ATPase family AAA domain-containing protein 2-like isoform X3 n=1 Tax=Portunus trituberculatus TaxID=210409 RepID=UPI001E1D0EB2|nr:ATPase family AAA domain-containing protein 2-like isoform X3 [Portunus trituberculatus]
MVATRGNTGNENERKSSLPSRESRRTTKGAMQEPEDELFWESDDQPSRRNANVTFQETGNSSRSPAAMRNQRTRNLAVLLSRTLADKKLKSWARKRPSCFSCEEVPRPQPSRDSSCVRSSVRMQNNAVTIEDDTDTDDEIFRRTQSRRTRGQRSRDAMAKEFVMNGDKSHMQGMEEGLRRSSRRRTFSSFDQSWLVGNKKLRGYPSIVPSSEPENEEPRPSRKKCKYLDKEVEPRRRQIQHFSQREKREYNSCSQKTANCTRRRRVPPRRYRDEPEHSEDEEEDRKLQPKKVEAPQGDDDDDDDDDDDEDEEKEKEETIQNSEESPKRYKREKQRSGKKEENEEKPDGDDEEEQVEDLLQKRRTTRSSLLASQQKIEDTEDEEDEDDPSPVIHRSRRGMRDPIMASAMSLKGPFEDMYSKVKRQRRPVKRFMYEDEVPQRRTRKQVSSSDESESAKEDEGEEEEEEGEEDQDDGQNKRYSLRRNRRENRPFQMEAAESSSRSLEYHEDTPPRRRCRNFKRYLTSPARKHTFHHKRMATHHTSSSSSSSDETNFEKRKARSMAKSRNRCLPMNINPEDLMTGALRDRAKTGSSLADIDPMTINREVMFDAIGGLSQHIKSLKEMIIFPLLYPEVFEKFYINPPRGVLFFGPPGTGKTLMARALANECSIGGRKVAFFMRKGADCLSKWVGESERQLRLLFDQAYQMRPSIIFFDEIDGLAPVRSSRQDQIHSSIVSTLLALMDGLDSRGEIVVIGATNRIDAIDPALRRPGRFDREFLFSLPSMKARLQILKIHTKNWVPVPSQQVMRHLAMQTAGYCGADLKALCAESALVALRSKYPQIYSSRQKLVIDVSSLVVRMCHFRVAMRKIVAAGQRTAASVGRQLNSVVKPLLQGALTQALTMLEQSFPTAFSRSGGFTKLSTTHRPRLLLAGFRSQGQSTHLAPAIIHTLEKIPVHKLDLAALYSTSARAPEEACAQVFHEARRSLPSIIYVPRIDQWWVTISDTLRATFISLLFDLEPSSPLLFLATSDVPYDQLDSEVQHLFSVYHGEMMSIANPSEEERRHFFKPLFFTEMLQKPKIRQNKRQLEVLPVAPEPEPRKLNSKEVRRIEEEEEATLRELRIFLREICAKLARNRTFYIFTKPVDEEEVPDYRDIIKEPMDLETMMTKIDQHEYECAQDFLHDIDLICTNALEYNPDRNPEDKIIRHRACTLRDTAYAYIKAEMDTDFEEKCRGIRDNRKNRYQFIAKPPAPDFVHVAPIRQKREESTKAQQENGGGEPLSATESGQLTKGPMTKTPDSIRRKKRRFASSWARGEIKTARKKRLVEKDSPPKKEIKNEHDEIKTTEEEGDEADLLKLAECDARSEGEVSGHSPCNSGEGKDLSKDTSNEAKKKTIEMGSELSLCNGHLSTEDSHDSMKVTSAADELAAQASVMALHETCTEKEKIHDITAEAEDSVVSSSEQGSGSGQASCNGITIDWSHLEAVYESCVSATDTSTIDDLLRLHTSISSLVHTHSRNSDRSQLLQDTEAEIRRFTQFHKKS